MKGSPHLCRSTNWNLFLRDGITSTVFISKARFAGKEDIQIQLVYAFLKGVIKVVCLPSPLASLADVTDCALFTKLASLSLRTCRHSKSCPEWFVSDSAIWRRKVVLFFFSVLNIRRKALRNKCRKLSQIHWCHCKSRTQTELWLQKKNSRWISALCFALFR